MLANEMMDSDRACECTCPLPYVMKKYNGLLGTYFEFRVCCAAVALASLVPDQTFYTVVKSQPTQEWDPKQPMPDFLQDRMEFVEP